MRREQQTQPGHESGWPREDIQQSHLHHTQRVDHSQHHATQLHQPRLQEGQHAPPGLQRDPKRTENRPVHTRPNTRLVPELQLQLSTAPFRQPPTLPHARDEQHPHPPRPSPWLPTAHHKPTLHQRQPVAILAQQAHDERSRHPLHHHAHAQVRKALHPHCPTSSNTSPSPLPQQGPHPLAACTSPRPRRPDQPRCRSTPSGITRHAETVAPSPTPSPRRRTEGPPAPTAAEASTQLPTTPTSTAPRRPSSNRRAEFTPRKTSGKDASPESHLPSISPKSLSPEAAQDHAEGAEDQRPTAPLPHSLPTYQLPYHTTSLTVAPSDRPSKTRGRPATDTSTNCHLPTTPRDRRMRPPDPTCRECRRCQGPE